MCRPPPRPIALRLRVASLAWPVLAGPMAVAATTGDDAPDAARGQRLIAQYHCGRCHTVPGVPGAGGRIAVTLQGIGGRTYLGGRVPNDDARLARFLVQPESVVPDTTMPAMGVTPRDARDIAAFLRSLR